MTTWRDPAVAVLEGTGSLRIQHVVTGGAGGEVRYGVVVDEAGHASTVDGEVADPDVTLTRPEAEALAVLEGTTSPNASFIAGRTKIVGATGPLLRYLAACQGPDYESARAEVAAGTD